MGIGDLISRIFSGKPNGQVPSTARQVGGAPVEIVRRQFIRTSTDASVILQETLRDAAIGQERWTYGRVWLASAAYAFFVYAWWNYRKNGEDDVFLRALNKALYALVDDILKQDGGDREELVDVVREAFQAMQAPFRRINTGDPHSGVAVSLKMQEIMLGIALTDPAAVSKALDAHSAQQLSALMSETFALLKAA